MVANSTSKQQQRKIEGKLRVSPGAIDRASISTHWQLLTVVPVRLWDCCHFWLNRVTLRDAGIFVEVFLFVPTLARQARLCVSRETRIFRKMIERVIAIVRFSDSVC